MTTTAIRSLPKELPYARIFLDDLYEIEAILSEEMAKLPRPRLISFEYEIDGTTKVTTHEELESHGGHSNRFSLNLVSPDPLFWGRLVLRLHSILRPTFDMPFDLRDQHWAIFGRVEQIFEARSDKLRKAAESIPKSTNLFLLVLAFTGLICMAFHWIPPLLGLFFSAIVGLACWAGFALSIVGMRNSRIYFTYSRLDENARKAARKGNLEKIIWFLVTAVVSACLGVLGTLLIEHLKHN
jgi:hypothetical protein